jgi:aryl-alcohol dehydrogenase-like predicted oxidoreductase
MPEDNLMEYQHLGRTGLLVSRLCLGTMNFGWQTPEDDSFTLMDRALDAGINFFDTANVYGHKPYEGVTEQIIGRWLAQGGGRREKIVLASKVANPMGESPNDQHLSAYHIRRACEDSLRRLRTDHLDLYQMHHVDPDTPWEEIWQAMEQLVQSGKVIYVGSSNFAAWNIAQAQAEAAKRNFMGLVSEQTLYNLSVRMAELEVIPACRAYGLGLIPWSPLWGGALAGNTQGGSTGRRGGERTRDRLNEKSSQIQAYEAYCREMGEQPANVALAWLLHNPVVTAPIIGPRTVDQLNSALHSLEMHLSEETLQKLDEIWPGPGGEAPMAYAW